MLRTTSTELFHEGVVHQVLFLKNLGQVIPAVALMTSMSYSKGETGPVFFMAICHVPAKEKTQRRTKEEKLLSQRTICTEINVWIGNGSLLFLLYTYKCSIYGKKRYFPSIEVNEDSLAANYTLVLYPVLIKVMKKKSLPGKGLFKTQQK